MIEEEVMRGQLDAEVKAASTAPSDCAAPQAHHAQTHAHQPPITDDAEIKPRKRKERHESIGSITQERKVVRSNSEERPLNETKTENNSLYMRRVASHEDFKKSHPLHERNIGVEYPINANLRNFNSPNRLSPHRDPRSDFTKIDDCEHEKRRSSERFSRPLAPRGRRSNFGRKRKTKVFLKTQHSCKENDVTTNNNNEINMKYDDIQKSDSRRDELDKQEDSKSDLVSNFLHLHTTERDRSPSPVTTPLTPDLDLSTLHEQIDCTEPLPSSSSWSYAENVETLPSQSVASVRMLLSPRNSIIMTRRIYLETDVPMPTKQLSDDPKNPLEQRLKHVSKQISNLKKKIRKFEEEFEVQNGYRPSHVEKLEDKSIKKLCMELNKMRKEHKQLKDDPLSVIFNAGKSSAMDVSKSRTVQIKETMTEIEKQLADKRAANNRLENLEELSGDELMDEKIAVQKALLFFESIYGRPSSKEDRDLVRSLYDRYRLLKRMVARSGMSKPLTNTNELETIHEHETMDFVSLPTQTSESEIEKANIIYGSTDSDTDTSLGENLHSLPLIELLEQQRITNEEKKRLRRSLKEYENEFQMKTGRKLQKDDRLPMEGVYLSYKQAKAKLRLLEALVTKHNQ